MTTQRPTLALSFRHAILVALGLTASTLAGVGGCADRGGFADRGDGEICADPEVDYATCTSQLEFDPEGPEVRFQQVCFESSDGCDPCDIEAITAAAYDQAEQRCASLEIERMTLLCGPDPEAEACCYKVQLEGEFPCGVEGRPLQIGAELTPRVAAVQPGQAWLPPAAKVAQLRRPQDRQIIELLRGRWLDSARYEHASVAAFARVGLQLLSLGAPAALVRAAQQAKADEVRHAQICFGLAAGYGGAAPAEAAGLRVDGSATTGMDLETTLREAIFAGALGEGAAAIEAFEGARASEDPAVSALLVSIAQDEQRHALLAYETIKWALNAHPRRAHAIVRDCLREGQRHALPPTKLDHTKLDHTNAELRRHGLISPNRRAWIQHESWTVVVAPVLTSMLSEAHSPLALA